MTKKRDLKLGDKVRCRGDGATIFTVHALRDNGQGAMLETPLGRLHGWEDRHKLSFVVDRKPKAKPGPVRITPIGGPPGSEELCDKVIRILMDDFLAHGQDLRSKAFENFVTKGGHEIRVHGVAVDILAEVQKYLDGKYLHPKNPGSGF